MSTLGCDATVIRNDSLNQETEDERLGQLKRNTAPATVKVAQILRGRVSVPLLPL